ncbi:isochorismate synthase [Carboxylicivirga sediminis]|uniref:isochorismate synthase n=1 Tax=Carboxylicivirga sediminis TaxID=2006564 RepID=A0A941IWT3_9BACT|nr:isochorismate synthase [Carboxylicivirga sediminis]MBR8534659.1 isochorismate synthase [Carboxylicivirga sediminis]
MKKELEAVIDQEEFDSIVLYRLPNQATCHILLGTSEKVINGINSLHLKSDGFVFEPFDNTTSSGLFIDNLFEATFEKLSSAHKALISPLFNIAPSTEAIYEDTYETYQRHFNTMHQALKDGKLSKVILSRALKGPAVQNNQVPDIFETLTEKYPHAFVYAISTPSGGTWMGAGPELLLKHNNTQLSTVSLAGTLPNNDQFKWTAKEITEQQLVTEYIENVLVHHQADNIEYSNAETISAGQVKHLRTNFHFEMGEINGNHVGLLYDLHPTPAVCGLPKEHAYQLIINTEEHDRQYYSGFLGPIKDGNYEFYVNIRCLKLTNKESVLYIGGGLTPESEAEKEWQETALKAQTLLSVLKNI